ncbi:MAG: queuosine precursor transporter [Bacteroidales bacterium]
MLQNRKDLVYILLAGFFITNAVMGEMIGGKLIQVGPYAFSAGIIPWPFVFLTTDLINEYFGKKGVRRLTFITAGLILYAFLLIFMSMQFDALPYSPVDNETFNKVFGQSMWIIIGSMTAFLTSQLVDVIIFVFIKNRTGAKKLWLRATGSTVISQLIDTFIVGGIAFWLPGKISFTEYLNTSVGGYTGKLLLAIVLTPLIYLAHHIIDNYLATETSTELHS